MNLNPEQLSAYKSQFPVLRTQTAAPIGKEKFGYQLLSEKTMKTKNAQDVSYFINEMLQRNFLYVSGTEERSEYYN
jgi:hypothetical protein